MTTTTDHHPGLAAAWIGDGSTPDPAVVGSKAATLMGLRAAGFQVPEGFAVSATTTTRLLTDGPTSADRESLAEALAQLGSPRVAVRSSAAEEDLADASYAGQYSTVLDVEGCDAVMNAVVACAASGGAAHAVAYARGHGRDSAPSIAVLVQAMVSPNTAGAAFSSDPVSGDEVAVVAGVRGLGVGVVDGTADPDELAVSRDGEVTLRATGPGAIDAGTATEVADLVVRVALHQGHPVDVEWAMDERGGLWLLQARPITALPVPPDRSVLDAGSWMKDKVHYPMLMTPFGGSVFVSAFEQAMTQTAAAWGLIIEGVRQVNVGGEMYGQPLPVGGKEGPPPPALVMGMLARLVPPVRARMKAARNRIRAGDLESTAERWTSDWLPEMQAGIDALLAIEPADLDDSELDAHLSQAEALLHRGQAIHFDLFIPYCVAVHQFLESARELLGASSIQACGALTGSSPASAAPARELAALGRRVRGNAALEAALRARSTHPVAAIGELDPDLAADLAGWMRAYGWRTSNYDPGSRTLAEQPEAVVSMLLASREVEHHAGDDAALVELRRRISELTEPHRSNLFRLLDTARARYGLREENSVLCDGIPCGLIRRAVIEIGNRLQRRGAIRSAEDVVYLEADEVHRALVGRSGPWAETALRRRAEQAWVAAHPGPDFVGPTAPPPDLSHLPTEGRMVNQALMFMMGQEYFEVHPGGQDDRGLKGLGVSPGVRRGRVRVVRSEADFHLLQPGEVMVCPITTPSWSPLFTVAGALVTDHGGALSHASIVARENGLPAVVSTQVGTKVLTDGVEVTVDGSAGTVTVHR